MLVRTVEDGCSEHFMVKILDTYSKEIVGWAVGETLETGHFRKRTHSSLRQRNTVRPHMSINMMTPQEALLIQAK